jgi:hypothetical protein
MIRESQSDTPVIRSHDLSGFCHEIELDIQRQVAVSSSGLLLAGDPYQAKARVNASKV